MNRISSKLFKHVRDKENLNQKQLADALYVNQSTISRIEARLRAPSHLLLRKLSAFTGKSIKELIEEVKKHP